MACPNRNPPQLSFDAYARRGKHIRTISCALASIECIRVNRSAKIWGKIETEDIFGRHTVYDRSEQDAQVIKGPGGLLSLKDTGDDGIIASGDFAFYIKLFDLESGEPISETIRWSPFISPMERPVSVDVGPLTVVYCSTSNCFRGVVSIRIVNEEEEEEEEMVVTGTVRAQKIIKRELDRADSSSTTVLFEDYGDGVRVSPGSKFPLPRSRVVVLAFYDQKSIGSHTEIEVDLRLGGGDEVIARGSVGFWVDYHDKILAPKTETITGPKGHKVRVTMDFTDYLPPR